jgi:hypothetical protein
MAISICAWAEDEEGNWDTGCGNKFIFIEGGPKDNGMEFCCYCGNKLGEIKYQEPLDQDEPE